MHWTGRLFLYATFTLAIIIFWASRPGSAIAATGAPREIKIAVALSLSGAEAPYGRPVLEGIELAVEETNAAGDGPRIALTTYDDEGTAEGAQRVAGSIVASQAALVLGPAFSFLALAAGPVYAAAGLAVLPTTATADSITRNPTTFRVIFKNSAQGELLATYLSRVLGLRRAAMIAVDDGVVVAARNRNVADAQSRLVFGAN
jgi:branched-chain amino acid transport system substrate-binding protein